MIIPLVKPFMNNSIKQKVLDVLDSGMLTEGSVTKQFEEKISSIIGCKHSIAVTSCSTGLEMALRCLGIGEGDEVIVPDYTYPVTATIVSVVGAKAIIVDIDPDTMLINYDEIEKSITSKTKAIIPVSIFGNPLNYDRLNYIKKKYGLFIIEDAACALGASYKSIMVGNLADISVFSLHPRKFITTGEGGIITTNNSLWFEWMNSYKHFGIGKLAERESVTFNMIGTNFKLSNILAAVGLGQLDYFEELLERRRCLAKNYIKLLNNNNKFTIPGITKDSNHSYQSFCIFTNKRDELLKKMRNNGIEVQIGTYSLSLQPCFGNKKLFELKNCPNSKKVFDKVLTLPLYHELTYQTQEQIIKKLEEM